MPRTHIPPTGIIHPTLDLNLRASRQIHDLGIWLASFILTDAVKADGRLCPNPRREIPDASSDPLAHLRLSVQIWLQKLTLGLGALFHSRTGPLLCSDYDERGIRCVAGSATGTGLGCF